MAKIKTMRFSGRRFGWKVGNSQIGVKEYFDVAEKLQKKVVELEGLKEGKEDQPFLNSDDMEKLLKKLDGFYRRLRAVESRTWTPMASFVIDRPAEDEVNLETFVKGHILRRIENELDQSKERETAEPQAVRTETASG